MYVHTYVCIIYTYMRTLISSTLCLLCPACRTSGTVHSHNPNVPNMMKVAGLYAEVIGVLSQARFSAVRRRFMAELRSPQNTVHTTVSIIEGMKFLRVKMFPVEELEAWFAFLQVGGSSEWRCV